jgi:hypothetical protein
VIENFHGGKYVKRSKLIGEMHPQLVEDGGMDAAFHASMNVRSTAR